MTCNTIQTKLFYEALTSLDQQLRSLLLMKSFLSVIIASIYSVGTPHRKICDLRECINDNSYEETNVHYDAPYLSVFSTFEIRGSMSCCWQPHRRHHGHRHRQWGEQPRHAGPRPAGRHQWLWRVRGGGRGVRAVAEDAVPHPLVPRHGGRHPRPHVLIHRPRPIPVQVNMLAVVMLVPSLSFYILILFNQLPVCKMLAVFSERLGAVFK